VDDPIVQVEEVMGTVVSIHVHRGRCSEVAARAAVHAACARLHELDAIFTTYDPKSPMSRVRRGSLSLKDAPSMIRDVLELCERASWQTHGWFDPWSVPGGVDPTGLVKGWAVAQAAQIIESSGVTGALVNGGGDVALVGSPPDGGPWRIGIQHPWRRLALACTVEVGARAIATSGGYERPLHLVDPFGDGDHRRVASASVTGDSLALADAFSTAIAVGGADAARWIGEVIGYDAYWVESDGKEHSTPGIVFA
jgi:FAD:protein FMN transferase